MFSLVLMGLFFAASLTVAVGTFSEKNGFLLVDREIAGSKHLTQQLVGKAVIQMQQLSAVHATHM